jgi:hypothetical protein
MDKRGCTVKVYHGTIKQFAEHIQREGLKPEPAEAFELISDDGIPIRAIEHVQAHVTASLPRAKDYARFRANYERAKHGEWLRGPVPTIQFEKIGGDTIPDAAPTVIAFDLPATWHLETDKQDHLGLISKPIPASYVTEVIPV